MEREKAKVVPFRREVMAQDTLIRGKTLMARTKHCSADDIRKKAREAERQKQEERRRMAEKEKRLQAEENKLKIIKQRRLETMMFLILLLIVVLFFVLDAVIGAGAGPTVGSIPDHDAVLMQQVPILFSKGC